ncbi:MAG: hypothetical protein IJH11_08235 [Lachnospiraceae bacterium]|nr:hypothetical protein [Lachnospiraceae bacterium]
MKIKGIDGKLTIESTDGLRGLLQKLDDDAADYIMHDAAPKFVIRHGNERREFTAVRHGKWKKEDDGNGWNDWWNCTCSECGRKFINFDPTNYCPECGARMDGSDIEEAEEIKRRELGFE